MLNVLIFWVIEVMGDFGNNVRKFLNVEDGFLSWVGLDIWRFMVVL